LVEGGVGGDEGREKEGDGFEHFTVMMIEQVNWNGGGLRRCFYLHSWLFFCVPFLGGAVASKYGGAVASKYGGADV
jgi:hypothetical protein